MDTYSFLDVQAAIDGPGGVINLGNGAGAHDEGITVDPTTDVDALTIGADGQGMHTLIADKSGRVMVRLLRTSPTNGLLSAMFSFQTATPGAHGQNTISVVNARTGENVTCRQCAFTRAPSLTWSKQVNFVEWDFSAVTIDRLLPKG